MKAHLFLVSDRDKAALSPRSRIRAIGPRDCRIPLISLSESAYKTPAEKLLTAHRIAAEVRARRGMVVLRKVMATWT